MRARAAKHASPETTTDARPVIANNTSVVMIISLAAAFDFSTVLSSSHGMSPGFEYKTRVSLVHKPASLCI